MGTFGEGQFFQFYADLQQSALYYSSLALRQLQLGNQHQCSLLDPGQPVTNSASSKSKRERSRDVLANAAPTTAFDHCKRQSNFPSMHVKIPSVVVTQNEYFDSDDDTSNNLEKRQETKGIRKVNFAHPLSVVKIKSPTPIHSMEDFGCIDAHVAGRGRRARTPEPSAVNAHYISSGSETSGDGQVGYHEAGYVNTFENFLGSGTGNTVDDYSSVQHKKRKRRKRRQRGGSGSGSERPSEHMYFPGEDPYAAYEVALNEDHYEFVSEVRLCTEEDLLRDDCESDTGSETRNDEVANEGRVDYEAKLLQELDRLYGEVGSRRIRQMEEAIENHFRSISKRK